MRNLSMLSSPILAVLLPLCAAGVSLLLAYPAWTQTRELHERLDQQRNELQQLEKAPLASEVRAAAVADIAPEEPSQFLGQISALARSSGCEVVGLDSQSVTAETVKAAGAVRPMRVRLVLSGGFIEARRFLYQLRQAPRLYTVTDLTLNSESGSPAATGDRKAVAPSGLQVQIGIERYVAPPAASQPTTK